MKGDNSGKRRGQVPGMSIRLNELMRQYKSQTEFADALGISRQTVGFWLNGDRVPDAANLLIISEKTGKSVEWLLGKAPPEKQTADQQLRAASEYTGLSEKAVQILHSILPDGGEYDAERERTLKALSFHLERLSFYQVLHYVANAIDASKRAEEYGSLISSEEQNSLLNTGVNKVLDDKYSLLDPAGMARFTCYTATSEYTSFINDYLLEHIEDYDEFISGTYLGIARHWFREILGIEEE